MSVCLLSNWKELHITEKTDIVAGLQLKFFFSIFFFQLLPRMSQGDPLKVSSWSDEYNTFIGDMDQVASLLSALEKEQLFSDLSAALELYQKTKKEEEERKKKEQPAYITEFHRKTEKEFKERED
jgi:hypothetical protein